MVIVDTAGRLGIDEELMKQASDIRDAVSPDEVLFVVDAMIGQDAVNTAQAFLDGVGYDGVVLTKLDGDARGGAALSIAKMTGKPVMFASNGEKLTDFDLFHPDRMASRILDMGDLLTLIEQAEKTFDADQAAKAAAKLQGDGEFTLDDFLEQMQQVRKMGSLTKMLGMLPGMGQFRDQLENFDEREIDRIQAIIQSMTPAERANPKMIDGSRRARIAKGSGRQVSDVNQLVDRFFEARKMMQQMARGGAPGMPGLARHGPGQEGQGPPGAAARSRPRASAVSGNPAKRAQQEAGAAEKPAAAAGSRLRPRRATRPASPTTSTRASCRTCRSTSSSGLGASALWSRGTSLRAGLHQDVIDRTRRASMGCGDPCPPSGDQDARPRPRLFCTVRGPDPTRAVTVTDPASRRVDVTLEVRSSGRGHARGPAVPSSSTTVSWPDVLDVAVGSSRGPTADPALSRHRAGTRAVVRPGAGSSARGPSTHPTTTSARIRRSKRAVAQPRSNRQRGEQSLRRRTPALDRVAEHRPRHRPRRPAPTRARGPPARGTAWAVRSSSQHVLLEALAAG